MNSQAYDNAVIRPQTVPAPTRRQRRLRPDRWECSPGRNLASRAWIRILNQMAPRLLFSVLVSTALLAGAGAPRADQRDPRLPALFKELKATEDEAEGSRIGRQIEAIWQVSGKDGVDQMMIQGKRLMDQGDLHLALGNFTAVTKLAPEFAEGWNKRASVLYRMGKFDAAERNVRRALALEPRHFLALSGLGVIHLRLGNINEALRAFEVALQINPHLPVTRQVAAQIRSHMEKEL